MQSILQYRRLGRIVQAQIQRDSEKLGSAQPDKRSSADEPIDRLPEAPPPALHRHPDASDIQPDVERTHTRHSARTALGHALAGIRIHDVAAGEHGRADPRRVFIVDWEGPDDPMNARNWPVWQRTSVTLQISAMAFFVTSASGTDATVLPQASKALHVSEVAESLTTGLFLVGMGAGSLIAGPFSETFGRNIVYIVSMVVFMLWIMAAGLAPNFGAQITFRFLAGCAASTPLVCTGGTIADMFDNREKTWGFPLYAITCFGGPMVGAVMGAYIGPSPHVSWRWVEWVTLIASGLLLVLIMLFMPETYEPLLLKWKAAHFRRLTGDDRFRSKHEIHEQSLWSRLRVSMTRPFYMLTEPIIITMTLYMTVVYVVLFTFLVGWPFIFEKTYGLDQGLANVIFISMEVGTLAMYALVPVIYRQTTRHIAQSETEGHPYQPEVRLLFATYGASVALPVSLFWLAWTNYKSISIWSSIFAVALFGFGTMGLFLCIYMYIIDSYEVYAASALTFVALTRYMTSGGVTVAGIPFYQNMGTHYALTIVACLASIMVPVPYILHHKGHWIRAKSRFAVHK